MTVIIAARLAAEAGPAQVLVGEMAKTYANITGVRFEEVGPIQVKGVEQLVQVYRAVKDET